MLVALLLTALLMRNAVRSGWGIALAGHRDHPTAATPPSLSTGGGQGRVSLFVAIPCAVAGATYAHSNRFIARSSSAST